MTVELQRDPLGCMERMVRQYGHAVHFHYALGQKAFLFTHPDHYRRILQENQQNYVKRHPVTAALSVLLGNGLVTSDGKAWLRSRRVIQPAFHRSVVLKFAELMARRTSAMLDEWDTRPDGGRAGALIDLDREMMLLTFGIVGEALFGLGVEEHTEEVHDALSRFSAALEEVTSNYVCLLTFRYPITSACRRLHGAARRLRHVVERILQAKLAEPPGDRQDLLQVMLAHIGNSGQDGLNPTQVRDEIMTLLLAGHETTATALTWTFYLVAEHAEVARTIAAELESALGRCPTGDDLTKLVYLRAVAQEAMRLYPPVYSMNRSTIAPDVIGGYDVPAGAPITLCPYITHRSPEFWEAPDRFQPERFVAGSRPPQKFAYLPFSAGARGCLGEPFAMTEMVLVLATVFQRYRLRAPSGFVATPRPLITLRPANGMPMLAMRVS